MSSLLPNDKTRSLIASQTERKFFPFDEVEELDPTEENLIVEVVSSFAIPEIHMTAPMISSRRIIGAMIPTALPLTYATTPLEFEPAGWRIVQGFITQPAPEASNATALLSGSFALGANLTTLSANGATIADRVALELYRLENGWAGSGSIAPSDHIIEDVGAVLDRLPSNASMPHIEVEEDDGSVALRWIASDKLSSFALVFQGNGSVIGVSATINPPRSTSWTAKVSDEIRLAAAFENAPTYEVLTS
jgi:hypothetical protein